MHLSSTNPQILLLKIGVYGEAGIRNPEPELEPEPEPELELKLRPG